MKRVFLIFAVIVASAFVGILLVDDLARASLLGSRGFITSGSKFGIEIGMNSSSVSNKMKSRGFAVRQLPVTRMCASHSYPENQDVILWFNRRFGVVCVASIDDSTVSVGWSLGAWQL